jgi:hypothetical protein
MMYEAGDNIPAGRLRLLPEDEEGKPLQDAPNSG